MTVQQIKRLIADALAYGEDYDGFRTRLRAALDMEAAEEHASALDTPRDELRKITPRSLVDAVVSSVQKAEEDFIAACRAAASSPSTTGLAAETIVAMMPGFPDARGPARAQGVEIIRAAQTASAQAHREART